MVMCLVSNDAEAATRWPARRMRARGIENAATFVAAADAARTMVESELGA